MEEVKVSDTFPLVVVGGSAGSLEVIMSMLQNLSNNRLAIILVVHRKGSLHSGLPELLNLKSSITVKEAEEKELIRPGYVYMAPADYHLLIEPNGSMSLDYSEKVNFSRPSIDVTFECAAAVFGSRSVGILLSGGNADGVAGPKAIQRAGGRCIVQDPASALVAFMPQHALNEIKVDGVLMSGEFAAFLNGMY